MTSQSNSDEARRRRRSAAARRERGREKARPLPVNEPEPEKPKIRPKDIPDDKPAAYKPSDVITLRNVADALTRTFMVTPAIGHMTPYDWWRRSKEGNIDPTFPEPIGAIGRSPLFKYGEIVRWYSKYKGVVPQYMGRDGKGITSLEEEIKQRARERAAADRRKKSRRRGQG